MTSPLRSVEFGFQYGLSNSIIMSHVYLLLFFIVLDTQIFIDLAFLYYYFTLFSTLIF